MKRLILFGLFFFMISHCLPAEDKVPANPPPSDPNANKKLEESMRSAENLCLQKGTTTAPLHFGTEKILNPATGNDGWHAHTDKLPLGAMILWKEPVAMDTIRVTWGENPPKWYGIESWNGKNYELVAEGKNNIAKVSIHSFNPLKTSRLRIMIFQASSSLKYYDIVVRQLEAYNLKKSGNLDYGK